MGTATQAITKMIIEIALELNNPETFVLSGERRLRINSSQFSGGSHSSNPEHQNSVAWHKLIRAKQGDPRGCYASYRDF